MLLDLLAFCIAFCRRFQAKHFVAVKPLRSLVSIEWRLLHLLRLLKLLHVLHLLHVLPMIR